MLFGWKLGYIQASPLLKGGGGGRCLYMYNVGNCFLKSYIHYIEVRLETEPGILTFSLLNRTLHNYCTGVLKFSHRHATTCYLFIPLL